MTSSPVSPTPDAAAPTLVEHYAQYFASPRQLAWYELMAEDKATNIIDMCSDQPHESILDIGAGDGAVLNRLDSKAFGSKLHAIDVSESGVRALRQKTWKNLVSASRFDGTTVPFADQSFDLAILSHVVEHLEHPRIALREAARVARRVYVEVPLEFVLLNRRLRRDFQLDATGHINFYLAADVSRRAGFRVTMDRAVRSRRSDSHVSLRSQVPTPAGDADSRAHRRWPCQRRGGPLAAGVRRTSPPRPGASGARARRRRRPHAAADGPRARGVHAPGG